MIGMKLYHGSTFIVEKPNLEILNNRTDFGKGFKCACNFIQEASLYNIEEILVKYTSDLSYTKRSIKCVIENGKSYQKLKW